MKQARRIVNRLQRLILQLLVAPFPSRGLVRIGSDYGGWHVPERSLRPGALCYSIGVGEDTTFDEILVTKYGCEVHAFDPTPRAIDHVQDLKKNRNFHFYEVGIWSEDGEMKFFAPSDANHVSHSILNLQNTDDYFTAACWSMDTAMSRLGHEAIDLLKVDIEGAEYEVIGAMFSRGIRPSVICVELHKSPGFISLLRFVRTIKAHGYKANKVEDWNVTFSHVDKSS